MNDAAKKRTERRADDNYPTPGPVVDAFLDRIDWFRVRSFLEPCAGEGAILDRARARIAHPGLLVQSCEIRKGSDYLTTPMAAGRGAYLIDLVPFDLVVTNPPFLLAREFLEKCLGEAVTVCFLLRASWPAGPRGRFLGATPPTHAFYLTERPSFVATCQVKACKASAELGTRECPVCGGKMRDTTDMHEYAWFCWDRARLLKTRAPFNWI